MALNQYRPGQKHSPPARLRALAPSCLFPHAGFLQRTAHTHTSMVRTFLVVYVQKIRGTFTAAPPAPNFPLLAVRHTDSTNGGERERPRSRQQLAHHPRYSWSKCRSSFASLPPELSDEGEVVFVRVSVHSSHKGHVTLQQSSLS